MKNHIFVTNRAILTIKVNGVYLAVYHVQKPLIVDVLQLKKEWSVLNVVQGFVLLILAVIYALVLKDHLLVENVVQVFVIQNQTAPAQMIIVFPAVQ